MAVAGALLCSATLPDSARPPVLESPRELPAVDRTAPAPPTPERPELASPLTVRPPGEAALDAQRQYGGRVLSVRLVEDQYRVKLLNEGEVRVVQVPAR